MIVQVIYRGTKELHSSLFEGVKQIEHLVTDDGVRWYITFFDKQQLYWNARDIAGPPRILE